MRKQVPGESSPPRPGFGPKQEEQSSVGGRDQPAQSGIASLDSRTPTPALALPAAALKVSSRCGSLPRASRSRVDFICLLARCAGDGPSLPLIPISGSIILTKRSIVAAAKSTQDMLMRSGQ